MNEKTLNAVNNYQRGVVGVLSNAEQELPVIDFSTNRFGVTSLSIKGEQYLIFSTLKEGVKGYPTENDVASNIIGIRINSIDEISTLESWLTVIKANLVSQAALTRVIPEGAVIEDPTPPPTEDGKAAANT